MEKITLKSPVGDIKSIEVLTESTVIKDTPNGKVSMEKRTAVLGINHIESKSDEPILSVGLGDMAIILKFNSDFPLLFEEGIKLWK